jgi:hypothetical protein
VNREMDPPISCFPVLFYSKRWKEREERENSRWSGRKKQIGTKH